MADVEFSNKSLNLGGASAPPKNRLESLMLTAVGLCLKRPVEDFREHYRDCAWCKAYVKQTLEDSDQFAVSEVGWWNGFRDRGVTG